MRTPLFSERCYLKKTMGRRNQGRTNLGNMLEQFNLEHDRLAAEYEEILESRVYVKKYRYGGWEVVLRTFPDTSPILDWINENFGPAGTCKKHRWKVMYGKSGFNLHLKFRDDADIVMIKMRWQSE